MTDPHAPTQDITLDPEGRWELVAAPPRRRRVAIVGFSPSTRTLAPFDDPEVEIWGLNQLYRWIPRASRWFELHQRDVFLADQVPGGDYLKWLRDCPIPVYMVDQPEDIPAAVAWPTADIKAHIGRRYFTSTPAMMLGLALYLGFEEIGVYGVDLIVNEEYYHQKPCMEYLLGWWDGWCKAQGRTAQLIIPEQSALLKTTYHYGFESEPNVGIIQPWMMTEREGHLKKAVEDLQTFLYRVDGALSEAHVWAKRLGGAPEPVAKRIDELTEQREDALAKFYTMAGMEQEVKHWARVLSDERKRLHLVYGSGNPPS